MDAASSNPYILAALVGAVGLGSFLPILTRSSEEFEFLSYDDNINFEGLDNIRQLSIDNLKWALKPANSTVLHVWEPVALVTKMCVSSAFGFSAATFARFGILCHVATSVLSFLVWRRVLVATFRRKAEGGTIVGALFASSVGFAVHPVNIEVVRWISANGYSLAGTLSLLSLATHIEWLIGTNPSSSRHLLSPYSTCLCVVSWILYACAIFAKPAAVSVSLVPTVVGLILSSENVGGCTIRRALLGAVPFFIITAVAIPVILNASASARNLEDLVETDGTHEGGWGRKGFTDLDDDPTLQQRLLRASLAVWFYLAKVLCPFFLTKRYGPSHWRYFEPPGVSCRNPIYLASSVSIVLVVAVLGARVIDLLVRTTKKGATSSVASRARGGNALYAAICRCQACRWFWVLLTLLCFTGLLAPALGIFGQHTNQLGSDRYCYLPFLYVLVPGLAVAVARATAGTTSRYTLASLSFVLFAICVHANRSASVKWKSSEALWRHAVEQDWNTPNVMNLATELMMKTSTTNQTERVDEAVLLYQQLSRTRPDDVLIALGWANALAMAAKPSEALEVYSRAAEMVYGKSLKLQHQVYANYAHALSEAGNFERGIEMYKVAIDAKPDVANERFGLANAYRAIGEEALAIAEYERVVGEIDASHAPSWLNLGNLRKKKKGGKKEALRCYERALEADPTSAITLSQLGHTLQQLRRNPEAIERLQESVRVDPLHVNTWFKLAYTLDKEGLRDQAIDAYRRVVALDPTRADAQQNLGVILHKSERYNEAIAEYRHVLSATPDDAGCLLNLGLALREVGEDEASKDALRRAVALQPKYRAHFSDEELELGG